MEIISEKNQSIISSISIKSIDIHNIIDSIKLNSMEILNKQKLKSLNVITVNCL